MSCLHPSPEPGSWHLMNYLWQEETCCNNQGEIWRALVCSSSEADAHIPCTLTITQGLRVQMFSVLANFNPQPWKLASPRDPDTLHRLEGAGR